MILNFDILDAANSRPNRIIKNEKKNDQLTFQGTYRLGVVTNKITLDHQKPSVLHVLKANLLLPAVTELLEKGI